MPIISKFTARTNGSFVKLTHSSIGWSYYSCDPEWGALQASHLVMELSEALQSFDVRFVALKGIVEVVPRKLNKGHIVKRILDMAHARNNGVDFVLCMGDDIADEKMFMVSHWLIIGIDFQYFLLLTSSQPCLFQIVSLLLSSPEAARIHLRSM